ncbi:hypothetical protein [Plectonema radiosum]|uniref:hypothetical protein n=1 Tax=Plectonema radiosum TaxID=945768 RepID=UPI002AD598EE|nr:hypothetical protein [Plectonema radiosum]
MINVINIVYETSLADFVRQVLIICGKKADVVKVAASNPTIIISSFKDNVLYISSY